MPQVSRQYHNIWRKIFMTFGEKISALRKQHGMTQADLGEQLNVTYQAVSKWERDESQPDFTMMSRMAKLFGVSLSYFEDGNEGESEEDHVRGQGEHIESATERPEEKHFEGVCTECGRGLYDGEAVTGAGGKLLCSSCAGKIRAKKEQARKTTEADRIKYADEVVRMRKRGFIVGSLVCAAMLVITIVLIVTETDKLEMAIGGFVLTFLSFFTVSQLFWDGAVATVAFTGGKIVGTPGVIFSLDLDGFIFLIVVKILFALIRFFIFVITFLFFVLIAAVISPFTFIPCLRRLNKEIADRRSGKVVRQVYTRGKRPDTENDN